MSTAIKNEPWRRYQKHTDREQKFTIAHTPDNVDEIRAAGEQCCKGCGFHECGCIKPLDAFGSAARELARKISELAENQARAMNKVAESFSLTTTSPEQLEKLAADMGVERGPAAERVIRNSSGRVIGRVESVSVDGKFVYKAPAVGRTNTHDEVPPPDMSALRAAMCGPQALPTDAVHEMKQLPPPQSFAVGDVVRVTEAVDRAWPVGTAGVIGEIFEKDGYPYRVDNGGNSYFYPATSLEPATDFRKGDRVRTRDDVVNCPFDGGIVSGVGETSTTGTPVVRIGGTPYSVDELEHAPE